MEEKIEHKDIRYFKNFLNLILIVLICYALYLAQFLPFIYNRSFDRDVWIEEGYEGGYGERRDEMLNDLLENHRLKGKTYREIWSLLGYGYGGMDDQRLQYNLVTDFRWNIDPMYTKDLVIYFSKDSIVTGYEVHEWDREIED